MEIPSDILERLLDTIPVARLATLGRDGRPHQVPIVFARSGGRIWSAVDGKPKREGELTRVANVRRRPQVSLLLDHYDADWTQLWWIRVAGTAEVREPATPEADSQVAAALTALRAKYPQYVDTPVLSGSPVLLAIRPDSIRSWCAGLLLPT